MADRLAGIKPGLVTALLKVTTTGDKILDAPLAKIGGKGLFVKEIEEAVLDGRAQAAVHSIKDVPAELPDGLHLAAIPVREDVRDVLISRSGAKLAELSPGAKVGTSSLRRAAQLKAYRPDLEIVSVRGNVDTRLGKLEEGLIDAVVLAAAGLKRLGLEDRASEFIDPKLILPAVGQGALGVECRIDDGPTNELLAAIDDPETRIRVIAERSFLARLEGGCQVPIACLARVDGERMSLEGMVAGLEGRPMIRLGIEGPAAEAERLGRELAEEILGRGGDKILGEVYGK